MSRLVIVLVTCQSVNKWHLQTLRPQSHVHCPFHHTVSERKRLRSLCTDTAMLYDITLGHMCVCVCVCVCVCMLSRSVMSDSATPWTIACQAPLFMEFSRQKYWSGLPFPSPGDLPHSEIESRFPALKVDCLSLSHQVSPITFSRI